MSDHADTDTDHAYAPPPPGAARSPCPALNALSAHGYLPRSGRNISFLQLLRAVRTVYHASLPLALLLTTAGFLLCGHNARATLPFLGTVDLHDLARHGGIEHDASLAHGDAAPGAVYAPTAPDAALLADALGAHAALGLADFARVRARRETALARPLDFVHGEITRGEVALILGIMGDGATVPAARLRVWMGEDRLPEGWVRPARVHGLWATVSMARRVEAAVKEEKARLAAAAKAD